MANRLKNIIDYVEDGLGGGMLAEVGMARLGLLLGRNIVKEIDKVSDDPYLEEKLIDAAKKVLNITELPDNLLSGNGDGAPANTPPPVAVAGKAAKAQLFYKVPYDRDVNDAKFYDKPLVFHCHHYNCFLQRTIEDASAHIDTEKILRESAAEISFEQLTSYFQKNQRFENPVDILKIAGTLFRIHGYGRVTIKAENITEASSEIIMPSSHYALGWKEKFGQRTDPSCHFATGFFQGAVAYAFGKPDSTAYLGRETQCSAAGGEYCIIKVEAV